MQKLGERRSQGRILECQFDGGDEKSELIACIMPLPLNFMREHRGVPHELPQGIGQLNFSVLARRSFPEDRKNFRRKHIAPDDGKIRRGIGGRRLFNQIFDPVQPVPHTAGRNNSVSAHLLRWYFLHAQDGAFALLVDMNELREAGNCRINDFIAQDHGKRLIADQMLRAEHRMSQSHGFRLADITEIRQIRNVSHLIEDLALAAALEIFFQFQ